MVFFPSLLQYVDKLPLSDSSIGLDLCPSDADTSGAGSASSSSASATLSAASVATAVAAASAVSGAGGAGTVHNLQEALVLQDSGLGDGYNSGYNSSDPEAEVDAEVDVEALVGQTVVPDEILAFDPVLLVPTEWYGDDPTSCSPSNASAERDVCGGVNVGVGSSEADADPSPQLQLQWQKE